MSQVAAVLAWFSGPGFGVPALLGLRYFMREQTVWTFMGFPTYGGGPFERWGLPTSTGLLIAFAAVCAAELVVGFFLWTGRPVGHWLAIGLLPVEMFFWIGFALPFGAVIGLIRTVLVVLAMRA